MKKQKLMHKHYTSLHLASLFKPLSIVTLAVLFNINLLYAQWYPVNTLPKGSYTTLGVQGNTLLATTGNNLIYKSINGGRNWRSVKVTPDPINIFSMKIVDSIIFIGTSQHSVFISKDSGETWIHSGGIHMDVGRFEKHGDVVYASTIGEGVFVYNPKTNSWQPFNNTIHAYNVDAMLSTPQSLLIAGGGNGEYGRYNFTTHHWENGFFLSKIAAGLHISDFTKNGNTLFAVGGNRVFRSDNDGINWYNDTVGTRKGVDRRIYFGKTNCYLITNTLYNETIIHIRDEDAPSGTPWVKVETNLPLAYTYDAFEYDNTLFLARSDGLYSNKLFSGIQPINTPLESISIYPNPSKGENITIKGNATIYRITIMNSLGDVVQTTSVADDHIVLPGNLNKGIYFLTIEFENNQTSVKKIIVN